MGNVQELRPNQDRAVAVILNTRTYQEAAIELGVSERSIYRWMKDDDFRTDLRQARRERLRGATIRLQQIASNAFDTLETVMSDHEGRTSTSRVSAARVALDYAYRAGELEDRDEHLANLEQYKKQHEKTRSPCGARKNPGD